MRKRIRALIAVLGVAGVVFVLAAPAYAQEAEPEHKYANHETEECAEKLAKGGTVDDCQKAPSPLLPARNEVIWGSLAFIVLLGVMWKYGVPAVKSMEAAREERIRSDLEGAAKAHADAEAEKEQYLAQIAGAKDEAGRLIEEARVAAESVRADLIARAETEANDIRARAQADIVNQRNQAMTQLRTDVASLSIDLAGRIVERNLDSDTNRQLVDSFIDQVSGSK